MTFFSTTKSSTFFSQRNLSTIFQILYKKRWWNFTQFVWICWKALL